MLLVCRFVVDVEHAPAFVQRAGRAVRLLSAQPGCQGVQLARSSDAPDRWVLVARFDSVVAYRRALSPFEMREHVVPLLSEALTEEPAAYETLLAAAGGEVEERPSLVSNPGLHARRKR